MAEKPADGVVKPSLEKLKALQLAMDKIEKDHGKGTIMKMSTPIRMKYITALNLLMNHIGVMLYLPAQTRTA